MKYNVVAGEELKKKMLGILDNPIPFNEDMSKGTYISEPFTKAFLKERAIVHNVSITIYKNKLSLFLEMLDDLKPTDEIHLYFGEDETCLANRELLIKYFKNKVSKLTLHVVNEYTTEEIKEPVVL